MALVLVFLISLLSDLLSCEWQSARERGQLARIAALSAVIEAMSWFPIFVAVFTQDLWLVVAGITGAVMGGVWGAARERRRQHLQKVTRSNTFCVHCVDDGQVETKYLHWSTSDGVSIPIGTSAPDPSPPRRDLTARECTRPPAGWRCTRGHHDGGPCAAVHDDSEPQDWRRA